MRSRSLHLALIVALLGSAAPFVGCAAATTPELAPREQRISERASPMAPVHDPAPEASDEVPSAPESSQNGSAEPIALDVPGYLPAVVIAPRAASGSAPLVIVTHGAGGSPEPHCARYAELTEAKAFVLCTRGRATNTHLPVERRGYFYDGHVELGREVIAALGALVARYGDRVDTNDVTFAGFSQGASMGILFLQQGGARDAHVRRVLLVEGGADTWNIAVAKKLREDGVTKVAIVCGQVSCHEGAGKSVGWIRRAELEVVSLYANGAGHTYEGAVRPLVEQAWRWLR